MGQGARPCWILFVSWSTWGQIVRQKHWEDTRRHKTSQDVTRPSQNCNANRHSLLHFNHTNITCPNVCPSVNCFYVYVSFITVWDFVSKCLKQSHISTFCCICTRARVTQWQIQKKCHDMIYPTIDIDLKSECLWTCSCRCHYMDFFYLLYLNGVFSIFCSPNIFTGCDVSCLDNTSKTHSKHIKDTLKNTTHINTHVV